MKDDAPALLRQELASPRWKPTTLALSGVTDAYQPDRAEARAHAALPRGARGVPQPGRGRDEELDGDARRGPAGGARGARRGVGRALGDDPRRRAAARRWSRARRRPARRLAAIEALAKAGVPVGVLVAPIIPGLTDHEIPRILEAAAAAGASYAGRVLLRLPHGLKALFEEWLERHFPERAREGAEPAARAPRRRALRLDASASASAATGVFADQIAQLFDSARRRAGLAERGPELSTSAFRRPNAQGSLFD